MPGLDVAGTVVEVGSAVTGLGAGDAVFGISRGSFAEYAAVHADKLTRKPANLTFEQATVVPVYAGTALQALTDAGASSRGRQCWSSGHPVGSGDYTQDDFADGTRHNDLVLDIGGNAALSRLRRALTPTGTLVIIRGEQGGKWTGGFGRSLRAPLLSLFVRQRLTMLASQERARTNSASSHSSKPAR